MTVAELKPPRRARLGVAVLVAVMHLIAALALVRAFAPQLGQSVLRPVTAAFDVTLPAPPPPPLPPPPPRERSAKREAPAQTKGAAAPAGKKAEPRENVAPAPRVVLAPLAPAPPIVGAGLANSAGARDAGQGTGAGGAGSGPGAGTAGYGPGGGGVGATRPQKIAGDIVSARDYPRATRGLRLGSSVALALTVGTDGRVAACRIVRPSADPEADRITCRLARERFRFRPAQDASGRPIASTYGWQQRWFTPPKDSPA